MSWPGHVYDTNISLLANGWLRRRCLPRWRCRRVLPEGLGTRHASLASVHLSQVRTPPAHVCLADMCVSHTGIPPPHAFLLSMQGSPPGLPSPTGMHLPQACISHMCASPTGVHLL